jgi:hypothetical protein
MNTPRLLKGTRRFSVAQGHSLRWRQVSNIYPRRVWAAYKGHGGITQALKESDAQVGRRVNAWERAKGLKPSRLPRTSAVNAKVPIDSLRQQ